MFIDSHCHLTYEPLVSNISKIIEDCEKSSVTKLLTIGTNIQSSVKCIEISKEYQNIYSSVGIHPVEAHIESDKKDQVQKLYQSSDKNIGYGETGLDFYYSSEKKKSVKLIYLKLILSLRSKTIQLSLFILEMRKMKL